MRDPVTGLRLVDMGGFVGPGWYTVSWSDGGADYTDRGPVRIDDEDGFFHLMAGAVCHEREGHLAVAHRCTS